MSKILAVLSIILGILVFYWRSTPDLAFAVLAVFMVVWGVITIGDQIKK